MRCVWCRALAVRRLVFWSCGRVLPLPPCARCCDLVFSVCLRSSARDVPPSHFRCCSARLLILPHSSSAAWYSFPSARGRPPRCAGACFSPILPSPDDFPFLHASASTLGAYLAFSFYGATAIFIHQPIAIFCNTPFGLQPLPYVVRITFTSRLRLYCSFGHRFCRFSHEGSRPVLCAYFTN